jgi:hypothetical protein
MFSGLEIHKFGQIHSSVAEDILRSFSEFSECKIKTSLQSLQSNQQQYTSCTLPCEEAASLGVCRTVEFELFNAMFVILSYVHQ